MEKGHWTGVCAVFEVVDTFRVKSPVGTGNCTFVPALSKEPRDMALRNGTCGYGLTGLTHDLEFLGKVEGLGMAATLTRPRHQRF